jgi:acyl carrier protein
MGIRRRMDLHDLMIIIQTQAGPEVTIDEDTPLISSGIIDSFRFSSLIGTLEARMGVKIEPRKVGVDNFDTPAKMLAFIKAQR